MKVQTIIQQNALMVKTVRQLEKKVHLPTVCCCFDYERHESREWLFLLLIIVPFVKLFFQKNENASVCR